jgi:hypothetical protein
MNEILLASFIGLATTSSAMVGTAIRLDYPLSKHALAGTLAFAAGALISALAIDLAYHGAVHLHLAGFSDRSSWAFSAGGFAAGALIYCCAPRYLELWPTLVEICYFRKDKEPLRNPRSESTAQ